MWRYLEEKRTPTSANVMVVNLFGQLLYCEKMNVNGRPRSFGTARFSPTMTLKNLYGELKNNNRCEIVSGKLSRLKLAMLIKLLQFQKISAQSFFFQFSVHQPQYQTWILVRAPSHVILLRNTPSTSNMPAKILRRPSVRQFQKIIINFSSARFSIFYR